MSGTPEGISGFRGAILTKDGSEARVYTNIENAVATPIGDIYSATSEPGKSKTYTLVGDDAGNNNIPWSVVERDDAVVTTTGTGEDRVVTFGGTVSDLGGTFTCSGENGCEAPVRGTDGSVPDATSAGGWTFAPTNPNGKIDVDDEDGYLQFGWWLNMKGDDVDDGFDLRTFADAPDMTAIGTLQGSVEGSATYRGGAAGKWAIASTTEDATAGGHFTATATIGVDFDADNSPSSPANDKVGITVSGTITDFMTGTTSRPGWRVNLIADNDEVPGNDLAAFGSLDAMMSGQTLRSTWKTGGAVDGTGTWEASFHGSEKDTTHPTAVDGTFNADIADGKVGRIQGAFGATKQ